MHEEEKHAVEREERLGAEACSLHRSHMLTYGVLMWSLWIKERLELQRQEAAQKSRRQKMEVLLAARQDAPPPETEESKAIKQAPKTRKPPMLKKAGKAPTPAA